MNILVLSWRDPKHPMAGGAEQVMHEHMKGWVNAGHSVTFFSSRFTGSSNEETLDGVKIRRGGSDLFLGVQLSAFVWYMFSKHEKFDVVVDQFHGLPFFTPLYVRGKKAAILQEVAKEVWFLNHLPWPLNLLVGWLGYITEPFVFLFYKNTPFMVGSNSAKEDLIKMGINQKYITIIPHGVIVPSIYKYPRKENKSTVIFLGALTRDKGIEDALGTFALLNKKGDFVFWVVGGGLPKYLKHLHKIAKKLKINDKLRFFGFVSQKKKFELLAKSHVLVNPSIREGWGLVNIEANAVGTPVVAYKSPGLVDSVDDGKSGILCQTNTPENLAQTTQDLLNNNVLYSRLTKGSKEWVKQFSWKKSRQQSLQLLERIV